MFGMRPKIACTQCASCKKLRGLVTESRVGVRGLGELITLLASSPEEEEGEEVEDHAETDVMTEIIADLLGGCKLPTRAQLGLAAPVTPRLSLADAWLASRASAQECEQAAMAQVVQDEGAKKKRMLEIFERKLQ